VASGLALAVYAVLVVAAATVVWRRPVLALYAFVVGLAAHNAVMAALYGAGVRGGALTAIQAWKEILLAVGLARVVWEAWNRRRLPFRPGAADWLALAFAALVAAYALVPQSALGGGANLDARSLALRHDLAPVAAYLLGRSLGIGVADLPRLAWTVLTAAGAVALVGLVDVYAVPVGWWRDSSVPDYFRHQLGYDYHGTGGLPENFIYNTGSEDHFLRRLVSVFLGPLATSYMLVVALLLAAAAEPFRRRRLWAAALATVSAVGLLFTFSRASLAALAVGVVVVAIVRRRRWPLVAAAATVVVAVAWVHVFPSIAPRGHWTRADLVYQRAQARQKGGVEGGALSASEPSIHSHLTSLREGIRTVLHHPQGYGLGNAGTVAARTNTRIKAGESNYAELGVDAGLAAALAFVGWNLALLGGLLRSAVRDREWAPGGAAAALAAVLALAVQTDVLGDPWLALCLWWLGGALLRPAPAPAPAAAEVTPPAARALAPPAEARS
jgi:hypothetical protein